MHRSLASVLSALFALTACGAIVAWLIGQAATDRWLATQLIYWLPHPWVIGAAGVCALLSVGLARIGRRDRPRRGQGDCINSCSRFSLALCALALAWLCLSPWRMWRAAMMPSASSPSLKVLHWNFSSVSADFTPDLFCRVPGAAEADLLLVSGVIDAHRVGEALNRLDPTLKLTRIGFYNIACRTSISDTRLTLLNIPNASSLLEGTPAGAQAPPRGGRMQRLYNAVMNTLGVGMRATNSPDPGYLVSFTLDAPSPLGKPIRIWYIDLPSSPLAPRYALAQAALPVLQSLGERPDLLVGDFNIPRGSASLVLLAGDLRNAYDQAGWGPMASWPRAKPIYHIDQAFTGPSLRVTSYELRDPGASEHMAQWIEISVTPDP